MRFLLALFVTAGTLGYHGVAQASPSHGYYQAPISYQTYYGANHHRKYTSHHYTHHRYVRHYVRRYYGRHYAHYRHHRYAERRHSNHRVYHRSYAHRGYHRRYASYGGSWGRYVGSLGARPRAWCGYFMRSVFGGGAEYNLAANWAHRGRPTTPHAGAVVVFRHHVGLIVGPCGGGRCVVKSGNWNNRVATVSMDVRNAIAFRQM